MLALNGTQAFAWNNIGHMTVAYIAWRNLAPAERTRVTALIKLNPLYSQWAALIPATTSEKQRDMYLFMIAATWADQIKSDSTDFTCNGAANTNDPPAGEDPSLNTGYSDTCMHKYWHFLDVRYAPDGTTPVPVAVPTPNAEQKIDAFAQAIHTTEADDLKSYDLVWLEHLIGDIHQPLHTVTRFSAAHPTGDAGGNDVVITGPQKELHAYWDDILGDRTTSLYTDAQLAKSIGSKLKTPKGAAADDVLTADWVTESVKSAETDVYMNPPIGPEWGPYTTTDAYQANALAVAKVRIALAGKRLAEVIKADLQ
jgi:hypothetical protein